MDGHRNPFQYPCRFDIFLFLEDICWFIFVAFPCAVVMVACGIMMVAFASGILYLMISVIFEIVRKLLI